MKHPLSPRPRPGSPETLSEGAAALGVQLSREQADLLLAYEELLRSRAAPLGMLARADVPRLRTRHTLDCLRAALAVEPADREAFDLGSGAGLPGLVVAIARPEVDVTLVESRRRRAAFLELAVERLGLTNARVAVTGVESLRGPVDLCFARALAPLERSWELARELLRPGGRLVYFAGRSSGEPGIPPGSAGVRLANTPVLESAGPLVIISRQ